MNTKEAIQYKISSLESEIEVIKSNISEITYDEILLQHMEAEYKSILKKEINTLDGFYDLQYPPSVFKFLKIFIGKSMSRQSFLNKHLCKKEPAEFMECIRKDTIFDLSTENQGSSFGRIFDLFSNDIKEKILSVNEMKINCYALNQELDLLYHLQHILDADNDGTMGISLKTGTVEEYIDIIVDEYKSIKP